MLYQWHEFNRALLNPMVSWSQTAAKMFSAPDSWLSNLPGAPRAAANYELAYRLVKDYEKPRFNIHSVQAYGTEIPIVEKVALAKPFCNLLHFKRYADDAKALKKISESRRCWWWRRCRAITRRCCAIRCAHFRRNTTSTSPTGSTRAWCRPISAVSISTITSTTSANSSSHIGTKNLHVMSVCQPTVPVLGAISLMASAGEELPRTMIMMGGPIDTRKSPTQVDDLASTQTAVVVREQRCRKCRELSGPRPPRLSGIPAARGIHRDESEPPFHVALGFLRKPVQGRSRRRRRRIAVSTTNTTPCSTCRPSITSTRSRPCSRNTRCRAANGSCTANTSSPQDIKGIALFTIEGELDDISGLGQTRSRARLVQRHQESRPATSHRERRRPLRHLQRTALARSRLSGRARFHREVRLIVERHEHI